MNVLLLTVFVSALLVAFFVVFFLQQTGSRRGFKERDALLPFAEDEFRPSPGPVATPPNRPLP